MFLEREMMMYFQPVTYVLIHYHVQNSFSVIKFYKSPIYHET